MNNDKQKKVIPLLRDIALRLWEGRAAVLVGAGFSRNAQPTSSSSRKFPMWNDLGDLFHEKIYCEKNNGRYSNVLKLADEVDAAFGRSALDKIIIDNIPDKEYEPSELHKKLLNLPWADVFTTNYDTLLERSCVFIDSKKYDIVINKSDLINAEKPRIIKLHGSLPSERPFIITEEDYRCYPKKSSTFVNTVQQALIENTLCLIGFSGDDPNFLNWIGWIRDNLDDNNSPKIFLISLSDFNEAQRKLLERRNIVIIDLSLLGEFNGNHSKAHHAFIDFLNNSKKKELDLNWPKNQGLHQEIILHNDTPEKKKEKVKDALSLWRRDRENYPGWCISPDDNRKALWSRTKDWLNIFHDIEEWQNGDDLDAAFELTWRINTCLLPIFDNTATGILGIINKYSTLLKENKHSIDKISFQLPLLIISLLRYYRHEGDKNKWAEIYSIASECIKIFSPLDEANLNYENVLFSYSSLKIDEVFYKLSKWEKNELLPFVEAKRAGLLAELGHVDDAISILENSLNTLRKNNFVTSKNDDFSSSSQEAYIMLLLYYIKRNVGISNDKKITDDAYISRWAKISQYKCDPMVELKIFEIRLEGYNNLSEDDTSNDDFDIGRRTIASKFGISSIHKQTLDSFSFLLFCEEIGLPPRMPQLSILSNSFRNAAGAIYDHCPSWALFIFLRIGNEKTIGNFFDRYLISKIGRGDIQESIDHHFKTLKLYYLKIKNTGEMKSDELYSSFMRGISELLSRLITKSSYLKKVEVIEFISTLYLDREFYKVTYFNKLLERTIASLSNEKKIEMLSIFLKFPIKPLNNKIREHEFTNPFLHITNLNKIGGGTQKLKIPNQDIIGFINNIKENDGTSRNNSSVRMIVLYQLGYVNQTNTKKMITALWSKLDPFGFPDDVGYRRFYFINNLHPDTVDTKNLMIRYLGSLKFPVSNGDNKGISLNNGQDDYCLELLGSINNMDFDAGEIDKISMALDEWFEHDKKLLESKSSQIKEEMEKKFENITNIITRLTVRFRGEFNKETNLRLINLVNKMSASGLRVTPAMLTLNIKNESLNHKEIKELCLSLYSNEKSVIMSTLRTINSLMNAKILNPDILLCLSEKIKWNNEPEVRSCLMISERLINEFEFTNKDIFIENLLIGLRKILDSQMGDRTKTLSYLDYLETKIYAAKVASCIYKKIKLDGGNIPTVVLDWKTLCESSEEFDEVINSWLD